VLSCAVAEDDGIEIMVVADIWVGFFAPGSDHEGSSL
jgi:hypothetical protein